MKISYVLRCSKQNPYYSTYSTDFRDMELPDVSLDSTSASLFSPASPDVKIHGKATRKFKKERIREAADIFDRGSEEEEEDDSLTFKHGKDNTFDRLCAGARGKNSGGNVAGRGRGRSPFSPVDDNSKVTATVFSSSGSHLEATPMSVVSVSSSDESGGGLFATPKEREDSGDDDEPLRVKKTAAKTVPKRRASKKQTALEKDIVTGFSDSMLQYCRRPVQSRETSSASDGNESVSKMVDKNDNGAEEDENEVFGTGGQVINAQPRVSLLQLEDSPSPAAASTPIGDCKMGAKNKGWILNASQ